VPKIGAGQVVVTQELPAVAPDAAQLAAGAATTSLVLQVVVV
jgi:hypothetical protein